MASALALGKWTYGRSPHVFALTQRSRSTQNAAGFKVAGKAAGFEVASKAAVEVAGKAAGFEAVRKAAGFKVAGKASNCGGKEAQSS